MARPRIHDEATAELLLDAAGELLRKGGPSAISVRAVADTSDLSFRAVYALFGSKQGLIDALAARGYLSLARRVEEIPRTPDAAADLAAAGVQAFRPFALEEPEIFRLTFEQVSAEVLQRKSVARAAYASYRALAARVARAREAGAVHPSRSDAACVLAYHSLCQGLAASELAALPPPLGPGFWPMVGDLDLAAVWRDALTSLVAGFRSEPDFA